MAFRFETANERWKWHKQSVIDPMDPSADNYNGWTNWDTWCVMLIIDNEERMSSYAHKLVERGESVQQLSDWALQNIISPYNKDLMDEAQQWTDEEEVASMRERDVEEWMAQAQEKYPNDPEARMQYVERMRNLTYGLFGKPQPTDMNNHIIQESKVNWQEIYDSIVGSIEEDRMWKEQNNGI